MHGIMVVIFFFRFSFCAIEMSGVEDLGSSGLYGSHSLVLYSQGICEREAT